MKNIVYSLCLLSMLGYAGGDILSADTSYENAVVEDVVVERPPVKVITEVKAPLTIKEPVVEKVESAPSNYYVGLSLASANVSGVSSTVNVQNANPLLATAKLGYNITENFALEGRVGKGVKDDKVNAVGTSEIDRVAGVYLKPNINMVDNLNLFGLVGYASAQQKINTDALKTNGVSYGAGLTYALTEAVDIVVDAVRYGKKDTETMDAYSVGLNYNF